MLRREFMKPSNNLLFPKPGKKKKRKPKSRPSILQDKDGRCFLCMLLDNNNFYYPDIEEHHVFEGPDRPISTEEGLTVYLCPRHHRTGPKAVHTDQETNLIVKRYAQTIWEQNHTREEFQDKFRKSYL